ncbi:MAG TPA: hypothetical protein VK421_11065 [Pyrinomonadaceae bacterium]|nr:hypothetical protein [Pyrinomonadaceae bacterium]
MLKRVFGLLFVLTLGAAGALAQEKGVDTQNDRIRNQGAERAPGQNGRNQSTGTGRGIDFGKGRTPAPIPVANPYRFTARRDIVIQAVEELMQEQKLVLDTANSNREEGVLVTQPYAFVRGAVVALAEISRYADLPRDSVRGWTRGRYTLLVEVRALDGVTTSVAVNARVEGRSDSASGSEWVSLASNGEAEREFIVALVEKITGGAPQTQ